MPRISAHRQFRAFEGRAAVADVRAIASNAGHAPVVTLTAMTGAGALASEPAQQVATGRVLGAVLAEVPLPTTLQEEHEPAGVTVFKHIRLVRAFTVQRHHRAIIGR